MLDSLRSSHGPDAAVAGYGCTRSGTAPGMGRVVTGAVWVVLYLLAAVAPLVFAVVHDAPPARGMWHDLSVALGFVGLAMLGLQFAISARVRQVTAPFGIDVVCSSIARSPMSPWSSCSPTPRCSS